MQSKTVLEIIQEAAKSARHRVPALAVGSNEGNAKALLRAFLDLGSELREAYDWPQLTRKATLTLVDGQERYSLPGDFDRIIDESQWNQSTDWRVFGPTTAAGHQALQESTIGSQVYQEFHIRGHDTEQLYIFPTPGANPGTLSYLYQSGSWVIPRKWAVNTSFAVNSYCYYDGRIYQATNAATTGSTPPTHISGTVSDGGIAWLFLDVGYEEPLSDTDRCVFDTALMVHGTASRFLEQGGFDNSLQEGRFQTRLKRAMPRLGGAPVINVLRRRRAYGDGTIPEGSWS